MSENTKIHDQLRRAHRGEAWHGPSVAEVLTGVTAQQAARRGIASAHTIWEIVLHIAAWEEAARKALDGATMPVFPWGGDWPPVTDVTQAGWAESRAQLERTQYELETAVEKFPDSRLSEKVTGRDYSYYFLLHGIVQHNLYHAGQIALLKKAG